MGERRTFWGAMLFMATWEVLYWLVHMALFAGVADAHNVVASTGHSEAEEEIR